LLAVLNEHRQILALNDSFLKLLGIDDPAETLGLRPGEALRCVYSSKELEGCGTTQFCSTCGAAIAIVCSLGLDEPVERICALTTHRDKTDVDLALLVRSVPIRIDGRRFLLLFLRDVTLEQRRAALERTFFHDINNMLSGLVGTIELLREESGSAPLVDAVYHNALRLSDELAIQRCLYQAETGDYPLECEEVSSGQLLQELRNLFARHPAALNKQLLFPENSPSISLKTDASLVLRVVCNMLINALEATEQNGTAKLWLEADATSLSICVWNRQAMANDVMRRVFQRNFSTKREAGRGIGTYSMKLFGEKILRGKISFTSTDQAGTTFRFSLPRD
jgi:signal transduction histidine kinase